MQIRGRYPEELSEGLMFFICPAVSGTNEKNIFLYDLGVSVVKTTDLFKTNVKLPVS
jgi:hypothetical protein